MCINCMTTCLRILSILQLSTYITRPINTNIFVFRDTFFTQGMPLMIFPMRVVLNDYPYS